ncbi:MAG TPA: class F sortase [Negativicutes bacterium]|uniref:Sortase n=1 Tax=Candidatus Staskawiczbacteria bacterium RIFCSPHIGHO2_01_FULL_41_41 TaxID=1802203 RepID=A0A1G2HU84_9BACT|nr:MAG: hypothetical protein A2822_00900 [Candidatus Staskawiczbacteria bacterium RIFCSPHIGHO2_01_FULL_41_41]OGZ68311.1 MAG: hypothetical protein A3C50_00900 [Candidatus Staskawiczbacteria bacterium RIFCSPHIGHO2_02_FULL_43_16]OGZ75102.1 MAG: hypothetical protein A3A12_00425 [Candidatus Staskawiczbacteria bacterium RIFCSPLOWO2_01_FULL_43_17b]HLD70558.1 class F sortase [Negativicutes bacterium]
MLHYQNFKRVFLLAGFIFFVTVLCISFGMVKPGVKNIVQVPIAHINSIASASTTAVAPLAVVDSISLIPVIKASAAPAVQTLPLPAGEASKPVRLMIPTIGVNAYVEHIGLTPEGAVGVPDGPYNVSWFTQGAVPGTLGSAVISGHYGRWKQYRSSVFDLLHTVKPGDVIYVKDGKGATRSFVVKETRVYGKDETVPEIFNRSDKAYLNIITCHGTWLESEHTYDKRFVVFAELQ